MSTSQSAAAEQATARGLLPSRRDFSLRLALVAVLAVAGVINCQSRDPVPVFDGQKAFSQLLKQCEYGPRNPGSAGYKKCRDYLVRSMQLYAEQTMLHTFPLQFGDPRQTVEATNIIARFQPQKQQRLLLCAHWDTRPWADMDPVPQNHHLPILGANDGASGVAVLLEIARLLHLAKPSLGVDLVLFDGEDVGQSHLPESYARGSAAFAHTHAGGFQPRFAILLDMVGDRNLEIYYESYSLQSAPQVVHKIWQKAQALGISEFVPREGYAVYDDHLPLLRAGIPCIDIIDFDYPPWHTLEDIPANCSAASLEKVGRVLTAVIYGER
jgi:glutaminyl-peptide cyclotransferase